MGLRKSRKSHRQRINFILMAIQGKKVGMGKVIKMIDNMVDLLKNEQVDDGKKKDYCQTQLDLNDDKQKELKRSVGKLSTAISDMAEVAATQTEDIQAVVKGIADLDKMVFEATENRKEDNSAYQSLMASDLAAQELLGFAKNRLNKFYNPKMYKAPPKRELSEEDQITVNMGGTLAPTAAPGGIAGTGISVSFMQVSETDAGAYSKKSEESAGVISMIDLLIADLEKEMTEAKVTEKQEQEEYEELTSDSDEKRATDTTSITEKEAIKGNVEKNLMQTKSEKKLTVKDVMAVELSVSRLQSECDFVFKYFDVRKESRADEIDALFKAKAVLSGADYSFVQTSSITFLKRIA